jgi:threonine/homoserine/homoserine lactone efflux protein
MWSFVGRLKALKQGFAGALELVVGTLGHTVFCIIGLTTLSATSTVTYLIFKLMGAVSLIYLGVRMWGASGTLDLSARGSIKLLILIFHQTIVMNLINLKVALFFGVPSSICGSRNRPYANSICFVWGHFYDQYIYRDGAYWFSGRSSSRLSR